MSSQTFRRGGRPVSWFPIWIAGLALAATAGMATVASAADPSTFLTLAGLPAMGSADGTGTAARFATPSGVAIDSAGNLYVADTGSHTIRKITPAGVVTTFAGTAGLIGSTDGTGSAARFNGPMGIAVDSAGTVYVADTKNNTIRKITAAGVVTTFASGFSAPAALAVDTAGNVYVADMNNSRIAKITPGGVVTTLAGGTSGSADGTGAAAQFNRPQGVAVDAAANVYVADTENETIRKITPAGVVTTFAGSPGQSGNTDGTGSAARFFTPRGLAVDGAGNIYVGDTDNASIRKITPARVVTTLAGGAGTGATNGTGRAATFINPRSLAATSSGTVYVADSGTGSIRVVSPAGVVTTLAGASGSIGTADGTGSAARFFFPWGVAVDSGGNLYIVDAGNNTIRKMTPAGAVTTFAGTAGASGSADGTGSAARFNFPTGLGIDRAGNLYVADTTNNTIRKVTPAGVVTTLAGSAGSPGSADGSGNAARFTGPRGVAVDSNDIVYVADSGNNTIRRVSPFGAVTTLAGLAGSSGSTDGSGSAARFRRPQALAVDSAGTVYVADSGNATIRKITPGGVVTTLTGTAGSVGSADGGPGVAQFDVLAGITVDSTGTLFVTDQNAFTIRKVTAAGDVTTLAGKPYVIGSADGTGSAALFAGQTGITVDSAGALYVGDSGNNTIRKGAPAVAPVITTQPVSQRVTPAATVTFTVAASGFLPPTFQWQVSTDGGATWTDLTNTAPYSGVTTATLTISGGIAALNRHQYRAIATNSAGSATSNAATLIVRNVVVDADGDGKADLIVFRPAGGNWFIRNSATAFATNTVRQWGLAGDVPVPGDYDGDGVGDLAVYRPAAGVWFVLKSGAGFTTTASYTLGRSSDIPVPGDYDGDGKTDPAVFRPLTGVWSVLTSSSNFTTTGTVSLGISTDIPVPADYDGDGITDVAVYRPATGVWTIKTSSSGYASSLTFQWGLNGDVPVPGDYDGDGISDLAVWRPANGTWFIRQSTTNFTTFVSVQWGLPGDVAVPADYDGDGQVDLAVYRPPSGTWFILQSSANNTPASFQWGLNGDVPAPNGLISYAMTAAAARGSVSALANLVRASDFDGDGQSDLTVFRPSTGTWFVRQSSTNFATATSFTLGASTDLPVTGDFDGDGKTDAAVFTPATGIWSIRRSTAGLTQLQWGLNGDLPVAGEYDGDGITDVAVYRPSTGVWFIRQSSTNFTTSVSFQWGLSGDVPVPGDYDGDGITDLAVYRPSTGTWFIRQSTTNYTTSVTFQWGLPDDVTVPGDYDGDGRTDLAVRRPSTGVWFLRLSSSNYTTFVALEVGDDFDVPVPGDFDGDGKTDIAIWSPDNGAWFVVLSSSGNNAAAEYQWGLTGDIPILKRQ